MTAAKRRQLNEHEEAVRRRISDVWQRKKKALGLTQESAARWIGSTQAAVSNYLNGHIPFNAEAVLQFAVLLKETPLSLAPEIMGRYAAALTAHDPEGAVIEARYHAAGHDQQILLEEVSEMPPPDIRAMLDLIGKARGSGEAVAAIVREQRAPYLSEPELNALRALESLDPADREAVRRVLVLIGRAPKAGAEPG